MSSCVSRRLIVEDRGLSGISILLGLLEFGFLGQFLPEGLGLVFKLKFKGLVVSLGSILISGVVNKRQIGVLLDSLELIDDTSKSLWVEGRSKLDQGQERVALADLFHLLDCSLNFHEVGGIGTGQALEIGDNNLQCGGDAITFIHPLSIRGLVVAPPLFNTKFKPGNL